MHKDSFISTFVFCCLVNIMRKCSFISTFVFSCRWLVGFVALRPKSTAMVIAGRSVHLTTRFLSGKYNA